MVFLFHMDYSNTFLMEFAILLNFDRKLTVLILIEVST